MNAAEQYLKEYLSRRSPSACNTFTSKPETSGAQRMVSLGTACKHFWTRGTSNGRASRSEYWWMVLANSGTGLLLAVVAGLIPALSIVYGLWHITAMALGICLTVRRLHDTNHSGWWWWFVFVPIIGWVILFVLMCTESNPHSNRYGPVPNTEA